MAFMAQLLNLAAARCWRKEESKKGDVFEQAHLMNYALLCLRDPHEMKEAFEKDWHRRHWKRFSLMIMLAIPMAVLFFWFGVSWFPRTVAYIAWGFIFARLYWRPTMRFHWVKVPK